MTLLDALRLRSGLVVFLDLEKAFELISPAAILEALTRKEIRGRLVQWVSDFLTGRSTRMRFQGHLFPPHHHTLGTPQGSCLSPFLFNILMEGLFATSYEPGVQLLCYADDLALVFPKQNYKNLVPSALKILQQHCTVFDLKDNPEKSRYMTYGLSPPSQPFCLGNTSQQLLI